MNIDLDKLEQVARAATPGEQWRMVEQSPSTTGLRVDSGYQCFFNTSRPNDFCNKEVRANIAFINSAKPDIVLELVRRLRAAEADAKRLDFIENCSVDLRCENIPTGGDDYDIMWSVLEHHMSAPHEREIGYGDSARSAIDAAIAAQGASHD